MIQINVSEIKEIEGKVQANPDYISLSQGSIRVGGIPQEIKNYVKKILDTDKSDYYQSAWGIWELRQKISENLSNSYNVNILPKNILVTHGCMGALSTIFLTILEPGDEVIIPEPNYPAYKNIVKVARGIHKFVSCFDENNLKWSIDIEKIKDNVTLKTRAIVFSNPCNPTGTVVDKKTLIELVDFCESKKIYLIIDEAYCDYVFDCEFTSSVSFFKNYEFVICTRSFSKNFSMSGWRIGYMVVPDSLSKSFGSMQDILLNCPNIIGQYAALYAMNNYEHVNKFKSIIKKNRDMAVLLLKNAKDFFDFIIPESSFYLFLKTKEKDSFDLCMKILNIAKVGLISGRSFGPSGKSCMRLCYARDEDILVEGIGRILDFLKDVQKK